MAAFGARETSSSRRSLRTSVLHFARDLDAGTTALVGRAGGPGGAGGDDDSSGADISSGGRYVTFNSSASNLSNDGTGKTNVYRRDTEVSQVMTEVKATGKVRVKKTPCKLKDPGQERRLGQDEGPEAEAVGRVRLRPASPLPSDGRHVPDRRSGPLVAF